MLLAGSFLAQFANGRSELSAQWNLSSGLSSSWDSPILKCGNPTWRKSSFSSSLWTEVKLLSMLAQDICAWTRGNLNVISLKQELFKRSQSGVDHIAVAKKQKTKIKRYCHLKKYSRIIYKMREIQENQYKITAKSWKDGGFALRNKSA